MILEKKLNDDIEDLKLILDAQTPTGTDVDLESFNNMRDLIERVFREGLEVWRQSEGDFIVERIHGIKTPG